MTYYLKDDEPIPGSDLAGYVDDKCDEVERLRAALVEIINTPNKSEGESAETLATMMQDIAFAAIAKAEGE